MEFYISAFFDLCTERPAAFGLLPIPRSKIVSYGGEHGFEGRDLEDFKKVIQAMDSHYLKTKNSKQDGRIGNHGDSGSIRE